MFAFMIQYISRESIDRLSRVKGFIDLYEGDADDPLQLWLMIKKSHLTIGGITAVSTADDRDMVMKAFYDVKMRNGESLHEYKKRFDGIIRSMELLKVRPLPSGEAQATRYLAGLDKNILFAEMLMRMREWGFHDNMPTNRSTRSSQSTFKQHVNLRW
jgi:hypothetical protein